MRRFVFIINIFTVFCFVLPSSCTQEGGNHTNNVEVRDATIQESIVVNLKDTITPKKVIDSISIPLKNKVEVKRSEKGEKTENKTTVNKPTQTVLPCFDYEPKDYDTTKYTLLRHSTTKWCLNDRIIFYKEPIGYDKNKYTLRHIQDKWYLLSKTEAKVHSHKMEMVNDTMHIIEREEMQKKASKNRKE